jgi:putative FmdB family regulatory protein
MAAYDFRCRVCDSQFEVRRSVTDDGAVTCPAGHEDVSRLWSAVALGGSAAPVAAQAGGGGGCCGGGCCA